MHTSCTYDQMFIVWQHLISVNTYSEIGHMPKTPKTLPTTGHKVTHVPNTK